MLILFVTALLAQASPKPVDWEGMIPTIRTLLKDEFLRVEERYPIRIRTTADVTGDGRPEALVYLGTSGASTDLFTLMRMEDGQPVVASFRREDGKVGVLELLTGVSVMHGNGTNLLPQEHAISAMHHEMGASGRKVKTCGAEAYRWSAETKTFEYDKRLSETVAQDYCRTITQQTQ